MDNIKDFYWHDGQHYYDTINRKKHKILPQISSHELVIKKILESPKNLQLTCIPTWSCNLRCPHCFVLKKLNKSFEPEIAQIKKLEQFINWHTKKYNHEKLTTIVIGGEPLLYPEVCLDYLNLSKQFCGFSSITTNLSVELEEKKLQVLQLVNSIQVSIDGSEEVHNKTRFPYKSIFNCFKKTIENLKILKKNNLLDKVVVASSNRKDLDNQHSQTELKLILNAIGCKNIFFGFIAESSYFDKSNNQKLTSMTCRANPCCSYSYMSNFIVQGNKLYADYFDTTDKSFLGTLDDDFEKLPERYENYIRDNMPILKDEGCMSCPALSICWGQCVGHTLFDDFMPSKFCHQDLMLEIMSKNMQDESFLNSFHESDS